MSAAISVVMAAHNSERFLSASIDSVLHQTCPDFECIIINDCSSDSTCDVLAAYADRRIQIITNETNMGLTRSLNTGLRHAQGRYIARMDAGDISLARRFEKQLEYLERHDDIALLGTSVIHIDKNGEEIARVQLTCDKNIIRRSLPCRNQFCHGSVMVRRSCMHSIGGYREKFLYAQDYDLFLRLSELYAMTNLPEYLYCYRFLEDSISIAKYGEQKAYSKWARQCARLRGKGEGERAALPGEGPASRPLSASHVVSRYYYHLGRALAKQGDFNTARTMMRRAIVSRQFSWATVVLYAASLCLHIVGGLAKAYRVASSQKPPSKG